MDNLAGLAARESGADSGMLTADDRRAAASLACFSIDRANANARDLEPDRALVWIRIAEIADRISRGPLP